MPAYAQNLRIAFRALARRPVFALTAVLTIAVAIAANTAIFSVVRGVLLASLPFRDPHELVTLDARSAKGYLISTSVPNYRDWSERSRVLASAGGSAAWSMTVTGRGPAEALHVQVVLGDFFGTVGLSPLSGTLLVPRDIGPGGAAVVVLGFGYWQRALGGDPGVLGRTLILDGRPYSVTAVLPQGVGFPSANVDAYVPMGTMPGLPWNDRRSSFGMRMVARVRPGVTVAQARADLERVGREVRELNESDTATPELRSLEDYFVGDIRLQVWLLAGAVGFVLLIAAGNVANLLLARGEERRQEMVVRTALGAERSVLVRQILTESLVLSVAGGLLGVAVARICIKVLLALFAGSLPALSLARIRLDGGVLGFALLLSVGTGFLFGLVPALRASRVNLGEHLKSGARGVAGRRDRLRSVLVVSELALALVLLVGAALMIRSLQHLRAVDKGFNAAGVLTARTRIARDVSSDTARWHALYRDILAGVRGLPGVQSAAVALLLPLGDRSWERGIWPEGVPPTPGTGQSVLYNIVSPEYFEALGVSITRGRPFTDADRFGSAPVAIIDETMAERFWPGMDPLNKRVTLEMTNGMHGGDPVYRTVIGVARNVRHYELTNPSRIQVYVPFAQVLAPSGPDLALVLRTSTPPAGLMQPVRQAVQQVAPDVPVTDLQTMQDYVDANLSGSRALVDVLGAFGATALLLASIGVFGVMSYTVAQRTREIGVRVALGATRVEVLGWVGKRALVLCVFGIAVGSAAAAGLSLFLTRILYQVSPLDLKVYLAGSVVLLVAGLAAALLPARRAAGIDPMEALRSE